MAITSLEFILFMLVVLFAYYLVPRKLQWVVLLCASMFFYLCCGIQNSIYVLITSLTVYGATCWMQHIQDSQKAFLRQNKDTLSKEEKNNIKARNKKKKKWILLGALTVSLGFLCVFKYLHFMIDQINSVAAALKLGAIDNSFSLIVPLGISFYTFQAVGYLVDVYWENIGAEKNYFKVLLFVSFFPQMTQGPISQYEELSKELFTPYEPSYRNYSRGFQRLIWGFFKKMAIADLLSIYVADVFANYGNYSGATTLIGAFLYSIQIYADFSGYMDIMCGMCEIMGIRLPENFDRPYFSQSIAEYWRRWHMSLGAWFKRYIYFAIGMSTWNRRLAKKSRDKFGKHFSDTLPASIALIVVWLATGVWHGASWAYITWGLVNGLFIIFSMWMEPVYQTINHKLRIPQDSLGWKMFRIVRTFILVTFIKVLPEVGTLSDGLGLWKHVFTSKISFGSVAELLPFVNLYDSEVLMQVAVAVAGIATMFVFSLIQGKRPVRDCFNKIPMPLRAIILAGVVTLIIIFGVRANWGTGGFMYANF